MKKTLKFLAIALCVIPCVMLFAACGSIAGKTYKFDNKVELEFSNVTEEQKNALFEEMNMTEEEIKQLHINSASATALEYTEDGKVVPYKDGKAEDEVMYYKEDGNTITIYEDEAHTKEITEYRFEKEGSKVVWVIEEPLSDENPTATIRVKIYYKKA